MPSAPKFPITMPPELGQTLGDRLKKSMRHAGLSVGDMSEHLEMHRNTISGWLSDRARPMKIFLRLWAEKTQVPLEWLVDGEWPACQDFERPKAPARKAPARKAPAKRARPTKTTRRRTAG